MAAMDNIAVNHFCWLQHCSALAKILLVIVVLGFLLTTRALAFVGGLGLLLLAIAVGNKLPLKVLMPLVLIPMIFASLFAISVGDWVVGLLVVGRAGVAALLVVTVFLTTPPIRLLSLISAPMPAVFAGLLFFTYRSFFILATSISNSLKAVKLRRGQEKLSWDKLKNRAQIIGLSMIKAWDLAERQYDLLRMRGLGAGLKVNRDWRLRPWDLVLLATVIIIGMGWYFVRTYSIS